VFRDQGVVTGQRHVEISQWFGELESTFYKHPRSPHPYVFRVSNVPSEGCTGERRVGGRWPAQPCPPGQHQLCCLAFCVYRLCNRAVTLTRNLNQAKDWEKRATAPGQLCPTGRRKSCCDMAPLFPLNLPLLGGLVLRGSFVAWRQVPLHGDSAGLSMGVW
jgi:hypothetical protein